MHRGLLASEMGTNYLTVAILAAAVALISRLSTIIHRLSAAPASRQDAGPHCTQRPSRRVRVMLAHFCMIFCTCMSVHVTCVSRDQMLVFVLSAVFLPDQTDPSFAVSDQNIH